MEIKFNLAKEENLKQIMRWRTDPEITKYMYTDPVLTLETQLKWFEERVQNNPREKYWVINVDGVNVGLVSLYNIDYVNMRAYWAYYIGDKNYLGKGVGKQVELNIMEYVFNHLGLNKLCCEVFCFNESVIKIHEKFGSKIEGTQRQHIRKKGEYFDIVTMGILKDEWLALKNSFDKKDVVIEEE